MVISKMYVYGMCKYILDMPYEHMHHNIYKYTQRMQGLLLNLSASIFLLLSCCPVSSSSSSLSSSATILVKIGGSCVTNKQIFEELDHINLEKICQQLTEAYDPYKHRHLIVHGAGSFGHFTARQYELSKGGRDEDWTRGFCETRTSVLKLNSYILSALIKHKLPATTISIFSSIHTNNRLLEVEGPIHMCESVMERDMIPVMHGDAVFDVDHRCSIFSGDKIMIWLTERLKDKPKMAVFLTNVAGVYDKPPTECDAKLIKEIVVQKDGSISLNAQTSIAEHDVTGGIKGKIECAVEIAKMGIPVVICEMGTEHSMQALRGEFPSVCTVIRLIKEI